MHGFAVNGIVQSLSLACDYNLKIMLIVVTFPRAIAVRNALSMRIRIDEAQFFLGKRICSCIEMPISRRRRQLTRRHLPCGVYAFL